jgi:hypothetical protein
MNTGLRAASQTVREVLATALRTDLNLRAFFDSMAGGTMVVSLFTPEELLDAKQEGLSIWLYRVMRDEQTLNAPPRRAGRDRLLRQPLPLRLHYLITAIVRSGEDRPDGTELEHNILGVVLQTLHDRTVLRGADLRGDFAGSDMELHLRLESLDLDAMSRVWSALESSYQLSLSYEVGVVPIDSAAQPQAGPAVDAVMPQVGVAAIKETP